jgi:putative copper resistance protein D
MQHSLYVVTVFIHILFATLWVGGMLFMSLMLIPALRAQGDPRLTATLIRAVGKLFHRWGWAALGILLLTGLALLHFRGISHTQLGSADFWKSNFGATLAWKLFFYTLVAAFSVVHDVSAARQAKKTDPDRAAVSRARKTASWLGRVTLLLSLIIVFLGVMLVRGNPWM